MSLRHTLIPHHIHISNSAHILVAFFDISDVEVDVARLIVGVVTTMCGLG